MDRDYAVFILSHGRANNVITYDTLCRYGYSGEIYIIIDNEDEQAEDYFSIYGEDHVIMFDKSMAEKDFDTGMVNAPRNAVAYARSQCNKIARNLGLTHYIAMDDDYYGFAHKYFINGHSKETPINDINAVFDVMFDFLDVSGAIAIAPGQGGDYIGINKSIGGDGSGGIPRKCMNVFFCRTDRQYIPYGALNEDVTEYTLDGQRGKLFFTIRHWMVHQYMTQKNSHGMVSEYLKPGGTYVKSFYSVMFCPSCVKIGMMITKNQRIHHLVNWQNCVPKILSDKWKKGEAHGCG